jgi:hypothetical protein
MGKIREVACGSVEVTRTVNAERRPLIVRSRWCRALVLLLAGWPLFMLPGMCICQAVRSADSCAGFTENSHEQDEEDCCPDHACGHDHTGCLPCKNQETPAKDNHPPHCPANPSFAKSWVLERIQPLEPSFLAALPFRLFVDFASGQRSAAAGHSSYSPEQPMYLTFCALLI